MNRFAASASLMALPVLLGACEAERRDTQSPVTAPGGEETAETRSLEAGASMLQTKAPLRDLDAYLNGFHFYNGDIKAQVEAHHYCGHLNEDVIQCVIYDGDTADAKLMGVEYVISRALFEGLPAEEKRLWHSHSHEVLSGQLIAPGVPSAAERELMEKLVSTYGKTWHTWHTDQKKDLPLGIPMLMMGFTADGQIRESLLSKRDARFAVSTAENRERRKDIEAPPVDPEANAWQKGIVIQLEAARAEKSAREEEQE